jgi:5-(carboxyamino)imidazole ribonucleotide mutase
MSSKRVLILMGSDSDLDAMLETGKALERMGVAFDMHVASAHRTPERVAKLSREARGQGYGVVVAGAGLAAHLAGVVAAYTTLPVIGVPLAAGSMAGADALFSTIQMPRGVPVATVAIGHAGCFNAGLLAAAILSVEDAGIQARLEAYRAELVRQVEEKDALLQSRR